jgi:hypothetical protein
MSIYVKNGTPIEGPSLCETCSHAHIARGYSASEEVVVCQAVYPNRRAGFRVRECNEYLDKTKETLYWMRKIAWPINAGDGKHKVGFPTIGCATQSEMELILDEELDSQSN